MKHEIICGECLDVIPTLSNVDIVITSPPYNMRTRVRNGQYTTRENSEHFSKKYVYFHDALPIEQYYTFHTKALRAMLDIAPIIFWNISIVTGSKEAVFKIIGEFNTHIKDIIVWNKGHGQPAMHNAVLNRGYELILILEQDATAGRMFANSCFERGAMEDVWQFDKNRTPQATFPVELPTRILEGWSKKGDTVLDPFCGHGTTSVACERAQRNSIGIEISKEYCELAYNRLSEECTQTKFNTKRTTIQKVDF